MESERRHCGGVGLVDLNPFMEQERLVDAFSASSTKAPSTDRVRMAEPEAGFVGFKGH
jgi:hypothetical protein